MTTFASRPCCVHHPFGIQLGLCVEEPTRIPARSSSSVLPISDAMPSLPILHADSGYSRIVQLQMFVPSRDVRVISVSGNSVRTLDMNITWRLVVLQH